MAETLYEILWLHFAAVCGSFAAVRQSFAIVCRSLAMPSNVRALREQYTPAALTASPSEHIYNLGNASSSKQATVARHYQSINRLYAESGVGQSLLPNGVLQRRCSAVVIPFVRMVLVVRRCDKCKTGDSHSSNQQRLTHSPQWVALCVTGLTSDALSRITAVTVTSKQQVLCNYLSGTLHVALHKSLHRHLPWAARGTTSKAACTSSTITDRTAPTSHQQNLTKQGRVGFSQQAVPVNILQVKSHQLKVCQVDLHLPGASTSTRAMVVDRTEDLVLARAAKSPNKAVGVARMQGCCPKKPWTLLTQQAHRKVSGRCLSSLQSATI